MYANCVSCRSIRLKSKAKGNGNVRWYILCFRMRYVAAYLLATLGGNRNPSKGDLEKILESVGLEVDDERLDKVSSGQGAGKR